MTNSDRVDPHEFGNMYKNIFKHKKLEVMNVLVD